MVIPYPPGGGSDVLFRLVASYAERHLGQQIVPVNMAGASATIGSRFVKDAKPDGYTILGSHQVVATAQHTGIVDYGFSSFEGINQITSTPHIPSVTKAFSEKNNVKNMTDFINYVKANPGKVIWAYTVGSEDHYTIAALLDKAGVDPRSLKYVSYPGTGPQYAAMVANQVEGMVADYASGKGYFESGDLVPLGIVNTERNAALPDVATVKEQGIDFTLPVARGMMAPKGTPAEVLEVLNEAYKKALEDPELQKKIAELGSFAMYKPHDEYNTFLQELDAEMAKLADKMK
ncbi:hypothetical protein VN24_11850 [Paenibacillus beijingensis]|uniref:Bug family protein n=2 Tax=Paenibacillus beijingensis TaxID=1126833 RepID=A0A0D5NRB3_9BACL|nr:hypothetical protein VN24_11850 [Paenibacillus beijingensis]